MISAKPSAYLALFFLPLLFSSVALSQEQFPQTQDPPSQSRQVRILLVSRNEATLSSPLSAPIREIPFRLGDTFSKGDLLVRFQCDRRKGELTKARAEYKIASETLNSYRELRRYESISELEVSVSEGELQRAQGGLAIARADVAKCTLQAPFDGTIVREYVSPHEYVKSGEPILDVIDLTTLEAQIYIPLSWLPRLKIGQSIDIAVDETALLVKAEINRMGARVDPESQMVELRARILSPPPGLMAGMSGITVISE
ncbi:MAG: efflux RND transporter periplasmic adaptor subunit [Gammaproteobacteria bacterium]|nr:efflux RND transporter periplasmic adaptor subunit [Gammaproteobacteria bacterium]NNJ83732.1 efflux RND transporter periplasmic adaptor subunit [Gammaproteobacteria bacterium]